MHHLDLDLFKYQIEFTQELLKLEDRSLLNKIDRRISEIPRHPGLKIFTRGLSPSRLTASEHRDIMKVMVFVVDDLKGAKSKKLLEVYVKWNEMYILSRSETFKESDLEKFQVIH
jgi:hypothetical protein